jgi:hypothetical protein
MNWRFLTAVLVVAAGLGACNSDTSGPATGDLKANVADPAGDTFGAGPIAWDLTAMTITRGDSSITVVLDFSENLISPTSGDTAAMVALVDFDTDQNIATGNEPTVDAHRPTHVGLTGMGKDFQLALTTYGPDSTVRILNSVGATMGRVKPVFNGRHVTIQIPTALLGNDDGFLNAAAIVGNATTPNDIIPEHGHLRLGGNSSVRATSSRTTGVAGRARGTTGGSWAERLRDWGLRDWTLSDVVIPSHPQRTEVKVRDLDHDYSLTARQ